MEKRTGISTAAGMALALALPSSAWATPPIAQAGDRPCQEATRIARETRLVEADGRTFLELRGRRAAPDQALRINGHPLAANGGRAWSARLPLETVRRLAAPYARAMTVEAACGAGGEAWHAREVRLPIGLLGHDTDLAALEVSVR